MASYDFASIEKKWQKEWIDRALFTPDPASPKPKYYCLMMFPYPSGTLHVGHGRNYILGDAVARYKMMRGFKVMTPMGWDAFGLPAENAAIEASAKTGKSVHPSEYTLGNIKSMKEQIGKWGVMYDWSREIAACHPGYYKWSQWLFLKLYERGLAMRRAGGVNWCPTCLTVLANEQVNDGNCDRCSSPVEPRDLEQWYFKITDYADRLVEDLDELENWPERVKTMQENWIGRSEGAEIEFELVDSERKIPVFTTRPDTVFGVTFMALAPEHPLIESLIEESPKRDEIVEFIAQCRMRSVRERMSAETEKEGMSLDEVCINPVTGDEVPIWVTNYAVMDYGTGAVMGVPAHDQRDFLFAKKYGLDIKVVIQPKGTVLDPRTMTEAFEEDGIQANSGEFSGLPNRFAMKKIISYIQKEGCGREDVGYRLRDWLISRQRYWGTPIPMVYCDACGIVAVPEKDLPVMLPEKVDFKPTGDARSPLANVPEFVNTPCPSCGAPGKRETDTMDTFVDSSWYYLRFLAARDEKRAFDSAEVNKWMPVDQYIGGAEHATKHLIYARFITKVLYDLMLVDFEEPFAALFNQGMILGKAHRCPNCGKYLRSEDMTEDKLCKACSVAAVVKLEKMSKSHYNVVSPDPLGEKFGADTQRLYILFMAPPETDAEWSDENVLGAFRFLNRLYATVSEQGPKLKGVASKPSKLEDLPEALQALHRKTHQTIAKVSEDLETEFKFNTAIAAVMELLNDVMATESFETAGPDGLAVLRQALESCTLLLSPMVPHLAEECWSLLGQKASIFQQAWPAYDESALVEPQIELAIQINGKVRGHITVEVDATEESIREAVLGNEAVQKALAGKTLTNCIIVPGRLVNLVVEEAAPEAAAEATAEAPSDAAGTGGDAGSTEAGSA